MGATRAQANRKVRQEALREQLANQKLVEKAIDTIDILSNLDNELEQDKVNRLRIANDQRIKLIAKYLPDLKSVEHSGDEDNPIAISAIEYRIIDDTED